MEQLHADVLAAFALDSEAVSCERYGLDTSMKHTWSLPHRLSGTSGKKSMSLSFGMFPL